MKYISLFSGIEAATVAFEELGWEPLFFCEVEDFPSEILAHHYPNVPNLRDVTTIKKGKIDVLKKRSGGKIDLLVGGSPCQSFSVAGLRKGLEDPRGNLMLEYIRLVEAFRPKWIIWENVPGALSSNGGRDFGALLTALAQFGYGLCYRVLDAQHFGVPQRRRRVFVVGCLGEAHSAFQVLFESDSSEGDTLSRKSKGENDTSQAEEGSGGHGDSLKPMAYRMESLAFTQNQREEVRLVGGDGQIAPALSASGGSHQTTYLAEYFEHHPNDSRVKGPRDIANAVTKRYGTGGGNVPLVLEHDMEHNLCSTLCARDYKGPGVDDFTSSSQKLVLEKTTFKVRKLTPLECERLQGFPDNHTQIPWRGKDREECPISLRYKALGNSMAVPVMRWIAERIQRVENL